MAKVLVFGGTSDGRDLVEWLAASGHDVTACSATEYGGSLLPAGDRITSLTQRLDLQQMQDLMAGGAVRGETEPQLPGAPGAPEASEAPEAPGASKPDGGFALVVDATHPYATFVTENVRAAAQAVGLPLVRVLREGVPEGPWTSVPSVQAAAGLLAQRSGNVLLTTGSKDLPAFVDALPDFAQRLYVRILPVMASLEQAAGLGIPASRIVAMQGPFSQELNEALIRSLDVRVMVTKASGSRGGFDEKVQAALATGCELVVIDRPVEEGGVPFEEAKQRIAALLEEEGA